jgi:chromosome segregation ATPase
MSRDTVWSAYIESMALLTKAERRTEAARQALEAAEQEEQELRRSVQEAREELDALATREAGGLWISLEDWSRARESSEPSVAGSVLHLIEQTRDNGHVERLLAD